MKAIKRMLWGSVMAFLLFLAALAIKNNMEWKGKAYRIDRFNAFVENGKIISLGEVFPFDWDYVQIMNTPGAYDFDRGEINAFAKEENIVFVLVEQFYLLVFRKDGQIVGVIQYAPKSNGPDFVENGVMKEQWMLTVPKEEAFFRCERVRNDSDRSSDSNSAEEYSLEYVGGTKDFMP